MIHKNTYKIVTILITILFLSACSTEKNTGMNRAFHYVNARYNGHFNANVLMDEALYSYRENLEENYYELIPLEAVPDEEEVKALYTPIDTAIAKVKKVISDHSMPTLDKPSKKNAEHNNFIDENWLTIGKAYYFRRDYTTALKSFKFINKYFSNDPSNYIGSLWMAKTHIRTGNYSDANMILKRLDETIEKQASQEKEKTKIKKKKSKLDKLNRSGGDQENQGPPEFPKKSKFELERTKAMLSIINKDYPKAIKQLENCLEYAKTSRLKGRVNFILGQLYEQTGDEQNAIKKFKKTSKYNVPYRMSFNAELKAALLKGGPKIKKKMKKMLRDDKNAEYKDKIYYTMALLELKDGNEPKAVEHLTNSAFYSTTNKQQKGMAYEKLADMRFEKRDYIQAQKYYDSCVISVDKDYPNYDVIKTKAERLSELVIAVETAMYEDSVQRIAKMDSMEQIAFVENVIQQRKKEAELRAKREAEKLRALADDVNPIQQSLGKGGGYWNNSTLITEGVIEFEKKWGQRKNEDHWRRSKKIIAPPTIENDSLQNTNSDSLAVVAPKPETTVESLMESLPKSEEDFQKSNERLVEARYTAGVIYKEQLKENELAVEQFIAVVNHDFETDYKLMSAFQLYKIYQSSDAAKATQYKDYILNYYPNSDYANYIRDPNYFVNKKKQDELDEKVYVTILNRYNRGIYYAVISRSEEIMNNEPDNKFRAKYMLLLAMSKGQVSENKQELVPILEQIVEEYPQTDESEKAQTMLDIIKNGYSKNVEVDFGNNSIYKYEEGAKQIVLVLLRKEDNIDLSKTKISDFTREFFPSNKIKISSNLLNGKQQIIVLSIFPGETEAEKYTDKFHTTKKYLFELNQAETLIISQNNLTKLFTSGKLEEYKKFYADYY